MALKLLLINTAMFWRAVFILCLSTICARALGDGHRLGDDSKVFVTDEQLQEIERLLPKTRKPQVFYHWGFRQETDDDGSPKLGRVVRWLEQGYVDQAEIDALTKPSGDRQSFGGGVYVDASPTLNSHFGDACAAVLIPEGTLIYDEHAVESVLHRPLSQQERNELGRLIPFIRNTQGSAYVFNHASLSQMVEPGIFYGAPPKGWTERNALEQWKAIRALESLHPKHGYLESLWHLTSYLDGISFARAATVNRDAPWSTFEPQNFEAYRSYRNQFYGALAAGSHLGISDSPQTFGKGLPQVVQKDGESSSDYQKRAKEAEVKWEKERTQWAESQIVKLIEIRQAISGDPRADFRNGGVRGGGDDRGKTFRVGIATLSQLRSNPYLRVEAWPNQLDGDYRATYYYPDLKDARRLGLSENFIAKAEAAKDPTTQEDLQKEMMHQLLLRLFKKYYGKPVTSEFLNELVSIHPFDDFNGRTSRLYFEQANLDSGREPPRHFISDFDLLVRPEMYRKYTDASNKAFDTLNELWIREGEAHAADGIRPPYLRGRTVLNAVTPALRAMGVQGSPEWTGEQLELIRTRSWYPLFKKWIGPHWELNDPDTLLDSVAHLDASTDPSIVRAVHDRLTEFLSSKSTQWDYQAFVNRLFDDIVPRLAPEIRNQIYDRLLRLIPGMVPPDDLFTVTHPLVYHPRPQPEDLRYRMILSKAFVQPDAANFLRRLVHRYPDVLFRTNLLKDYLKSEVVPATDKSEVMKTVAHRLQVADVGVAGKLFDHLTGLADIQEPKLLTELWKWFGKLKQRRDPLATVSYLDYQRTTFGNLLRLLSHLKLSEQERESLEQVLEKALISDRLLPEGIRLVEEVSHNLGGVALPRLQHWLDTPSEATRQAALNLLAEFSADLPEPLRHTAFDVAKAGAAQIESASLREGAEHYLSTRPDLPSDYVESRLRAVSLERAVPVIQMALQQAKLSPAASRRLYQLLTKWLKRSPHSLSTELLHQSLARDDVPQDFVGMVFRLRGIGNQEASCEWRLTRYAQRVIHQIKQSFRRAG
jgi:hypothetical protein